MANKISNISKMKLRESFVQVNFLKGFKYIDKAGEILNLYQKETGYISYSLSPDMLLISKPTTQIVELRTSNTDFWCHYVEPSNLGEISRTFQKEAETVLGITHVSDFERVGWRNRYVYDLANRREDLNPLTNLSQSKTQIIQTEISLSNKIKSIVRINLVQKKGEDHVGVQFDLDTFIKSRISISELSGRLKDIKNSIESDQIKEFVNDTLKLLK